jgi:hypothetical protein
MVTAGGLLLKDWEELVCGFQRWNRLLWKGEALLWKHGGQGVQGARAGKAKGQIGHIFAQLAT